MDKRKKLTLKEIQERELSMMRLFVSLCERHGLTYWLGGGTLLGAVRHKGFIPWDDDIDLMMPRYDYDRLMQYADEIDSTGRYRLASYELGNLNYPFAKIYDTDTVIRKLYDEDKTETNIWIDIFPLDGMPDDEKEVKKIYARTMLARRILRLKQARDGEGKTAVRRLLKPMAKVLLRPVDDESLLKYIDKNCRAYSVEESHYMGGIANGYGPWERMPKKPFLKPCRLEFEGEEVSVPGCWDYYLKRLYGDYMQLPPEEKRQCHEMDVWALPGAEEAGDSGQAAGGDK